MNIITDLDGKSIKVIGKINGSDVEITIPMMSIRALIPDLCENCRVKGLQVADGCGPTGWTPQRVASEISE